MVSVCIPLCIPSYHQQVVDKITFPTIYNNPILEKKKFSQSGSKLTVRPEVVTILQKKNYTISIPIKF